MKTSIIFATPRVSDLSYKCLLFPLTSIFFPFIIFRLKLVSKALLTICVLLKDSPPRKTTLYGMTSFQILADLEHWFNILKQASNLISSVLNCWNLLESMLAGRERKMKVFENFLLCCSEVGKFFIFFYGRGLDIWPARGMKYKRAPLPEMPLYPNMRISPQS